LGEPLYKWPPKKREISTTGRFIFRCGGKADFTTSGPRERKFMTASLKTTDQSLQRSHRVNRHATGRSEKEYTNISERVQRRHTEPKTEKATKEEKPRKGLTVIAANIHGFLIAADLESQSQAFSLGQGEDKTQ